jgi:predicted deacylase
MRLVERGSGRPRVAVVGGIHGDEPSGERIVERLVDRLDEDDVEGTVQLLVANEPALAAGVRYTETDLNRTFPGEVDSEEYERSLATRVTAILEGADAILALHSSQSAPPPFAIYSRLTESVRRTIAGLPVEYVLDAGNLRGTTLDSTLPHTVSIEVGKQGSAAAVEFGYDATVAYLRAHGSLTDAEPTFTPTTVVEGLEEVPKGGGDPHVYYENFEDVPVGEVFARDDVYTHRVEREGIVPVLASEHGYEDIFGMYGRVTSTLDPSDEETTRSTLDPSDEA